MPTNGLAPPDMPWLFTRPGQPNGLGPPTLNYAAPPDAGGQTLGSAVADTGANAWQWLQDQRAESVRQGLLDPDTGLPTQKGLVDAARATAEGVMMGTTAPGIRAYHGSPADFTRFDDRFIGTGEGAQAYGRGHYFGEKEGTARSYRDALTAEQGVGHYWQDASGNKVDIGALSNLAEKGDPQGFAASMLHQRGSVDEAIADVSRYGPDAFIGGKPEMDATLAGLQDMKARGLERVKDTGHMYEVNIGADPDHFLHWDKPLSEQSPQVQDVLDQQGIARRENQPYITGRDVHDFLSKGEQDPAAAAQRLKDLGIPGIRYLDQGSRGAGEGTHNYVVFDPATIEILRKYGIAGLIASGGAAAAGTQQQQPPTQ